MKNLNLKSYQAYHPYSIPTNHTNHRNSLQQHHLPYPPANSTASASASASASSSQRFYTNSTYNSNDYMPTTTTTITNAIHFPTPPTLGNYLEQQQQQRQQHSHNQQPQQQQQQQSQTQTQLGLNQNTICNYNFYFNNNNNSPNNTFDNNHNNHSHSNSLNASNHSNSALSRAPQRPQRPTSLNLSSVNSLPNKYSSAACVRTPASTGDIPLNCHLVRSNSNSSNLNNNANNYYNHQRENLFNFPLTSNSNYNNYNFQTFNNYNAVQQQQQQLHQFQLLQQQFKQQQQQQQQPVANCDIKQSTTAISSISNPLSAAYAAAAMTSTATAASTDTAVYQSNSNYNSGNTNNNNNKTNNNNNNSNNSNSNNNNNCDKISMDASEIANFLANELFMQQLVSMECMQTGVPTLTTPTLTPTTLKSIEESFIQLTSEPINAPYQAGFIPPPLGSYSIIANNNNNNNNNQQSATASAISANTVLNNVYLGDLSTEASLQDYGALNDSETENSQGSWMGQHVNEENSMATTDTSSATDTASFQNGLALGASNLNNSNSSTTNDFSSVNLGVLAAVTAAAKLSTNNNTSLSATNTTTTTTRRGGGRRPATNTNISPEEEEKRRVRRERNKLAAARCRKRRVDQTNELTDEVSVLEHKRMELQKQIEQLNSTKQELEFILEQHRPSCQRVVQQDLLNVNTFVNENITGLDTTLASTARSISPIDLKPVLNDQLLAQIKPEPLDPSLDSTSQDSLDDDQDGPPSPKRLLLTNNNPMIPPPLPSISTLSKPMADASASLNTPIVTSAPVSFGNIFTPNLNSIIKPNSKQRPNSLPVPRSVVNQNLLLSVNDNKPPTDINGVAIQTPSTGMFNFDSLMDGGTGLTPVSGPLVPNCSQNKHPLELVTPTSEPSKLVSL